MSGSDLSQFAPSPLWSSMGENTGRNVGGFAVILGNGEPGGFGFIGLN